MQGLLFTRDFLAEGIAETAGWQRIDDAQVAAFIRRLEEIFVGHPMDAVRNEAETEAALIVPVLQALGWTALLPQQNAAARGRDDVPDLALFANDESLRAARAEARPDRRYRHALAIVECKRWMRSLDRADSGQMLDASAPAAQMLRYLSRVEVASDRRVQWGVLTNGRYWRLYWQGARSRSEEFLEVDVAAIAGMAPAQAELFDGVALDRGHWARIFLAMFGREAFVSSAHDARGKTYHQLALDETRHWEARVSQGIGDVVFDRVFPRLVRALARADPGAPVPRTPEYLEEVRRAALGLLYRLLFLLYAEDRRLLPVDDHRYDDYSLRRIREDVARRIDAGDVFSTTQSRYYRQLQELGNAIDQGDVAIGLPAYNGGLFDTDAHALLARVALPDAEFANLLDDIARVEHRGRRRWINFRDLAVQHLGSIYERLLEQTLGLDADGGITVTLAPFARKNSGSYYTHDDLVQLILRNSLGPLIQDRLDAFDEAIRWARRHRESNHAQLNARLAEADPAEAILNLKVCDPAMGSGHFLVSLVDFLADRTLEYLDEASSRVAAASLGFAYRSPLLRRIEDIRRRILDAAAQGRWTLDPAQLDDRHLIRRMILKRVVHGVDKNPMAVELAKVALWLHTFTVGAPLSFLDHHLRCGDSLYGERIGSVVADLRRMGGLLNENDMARIALSATSLNEISELTDVDIAEVERSRALMDDVHAGLAPLRNLLDFWHGLRWLAPLDTPPRKRTQRHRASADILAGTYGRDLIEVLRRNVPLQATDPERDREVNDFLDEVRALSRREGFLHWELAFPTVWRNLANGDPQGGFDAIVGNPPWDRIKLQEVEWFAERRPEIAMQARAADRTRMVNALKEHDAPLAAQFEAAAERAATVARVARDCGEYPLLARGDINLYSLFVERASRLVQGQGVVGLLVPSGIAADLGAAPFFRQVATGGHLGYLYDFENRRVFFPAIHASFKFSALVFAGGRRQFPRTRCAFFLHSVGELEDANRAIELGPEDFEVVNPNTGTAPIFRSRRDAELTTRIYRSHPVLVRYEPAGQDAGVLVERPLWPVRYVRMFDMTNDSGLFRRRDELEADGWYPVDGNRWRRAEELALPLYEGKMVQAYDHRAASIVINAANLSRPAQPVPASEHQHCDATWLPTSQYWVPEPEISNRVGEFNWLIGFKEITAPTNQRTMIAAVLPCAGFGNKIPVFLPRPGLEWTTYAEVAPLLLANLNSLALDYVARQKLQGQTLNLYIIEQLPLISPERFDGRIGLISIGDFVRQEILRLSYTAVDLRRFAIELGYEGDPFPWDEEDRRHRMARLDALFMRLYGLDRDDAAYVLDTFPIVREQDLAQFGRYRTRDLVLAYMNCLAAGDITTVVDL